MRLIDADKVCEILDDIDGFTFFVPESVKQLLEEVPTVEPTWKWISVKDKLPEAGKHVLADCEVRLMSGRKMHYVCEAYYAPTHTISTGTTPDYDGSYEYDETDDEYYLLEGWYECIHNWDDYSSVVIGDFVTHWMPLPEPPKMEGGETDGKN